MDLRVGCAGWSIPRIHAGTFPGTGTHLQRYARVFNAVEINSSFHRPHARQTYERWAPSVPQDFRFAVKMPREISHVRALVAAEEPLLRFLAAVAGLGGLLDVLLLQLPPRLRFDAAGVRRFFDLLRHHHSGPVVCEPRHPGWFTPAADRLLARMQVARVAADPPPVPGADRPGAWPGCVYVRLHGSPRRYYSSYPSPFLDAWARRVLHYRDAGVSTWLIFDNTAAGAAIDNALTVQRRISST